MRRVSAVVHAPLVKQLQEAVGLQTTLADHVVIRAARARHSYRRYLERALGVERGIDTMLANFTLDWDISSRSKAPLIGADLLGLGASVEEILALPMCTAMQDVRDPVGAHCWLFVVERISTAHWVAYHQLDFVVREIAASYLRALLAGRNWEQVCEAFGRFTLDDQVVEQFIATAEQAVRRHYGWFAEAEDGDNAIERAEPRRARGSDSLSRPLDREAVMIVPPTKRVDGGSGEAMASDASPSAPNEEAVRPPPGDD